MPSKTPSTATPRRSVAWPGFVNELSAALATLREDDFLILEIKNSGRFVQFCCGGKHGWRAETCSNAFLQGADRLGDDEIAGLLKLGWLEPTGSPQDSTPENDPDGSPNFYIDAAIDLDDLAELAVETLSGTLAVPYPAMLRYRAGDSSGYEKRIAVLRLQEATDAQPEEGKLLQFVQETLASVPGVTRADVDEGGLQITLDGLTVTVSAFEQHRLLRLRSLLLTEGKPSVELLLTMNHYNRDCPVLRVALDDDGVHALTELPTVSLSVACLLERFQEFCVFAGLTGRDLQEEFGGKLTYTECPTDSTWH